MGFFIRIIFKKYFWRAASCAALMLCAACGTAPAAKVQGFQTGTAAAFLHDFAPVSFKIDKYEAAMARPYRPHVAGGGIEAVHRAVNANAYHPDPADVWDPAGLWKHGGDCEDFAMAKARELQAQGIDRTYLMVMTSLGNGITHAVLLVDDGGSFVALDNQRPEPVGLAREIAAWRPRYLIEIKTGHVFVPMV